MKDLESVLPCIGRNVFAKCDPEDGYHISGCPAGCVPAVQAWSDAQISAVNKEWFIKYTARGVTLRAAEAKVAGALKRIGDDADHSDDRTEEELRDILDTIQRSADAALAEAAPPLRNATDAELEAQRASWVRGEMAMGSDADEARERKRSREAAPTCETCGGSGFVRPAMDLMLRPPKEQAEYEAEVCSHMVPCPAPDCSHRRER